MSSLSAQSSLSRDGAEWGPFSSCGERGGKKGRGRYLLKPGIIKDGVQPFWFDVVQADLLDQCQQLLIDFLRLTSSFRAIRPLFDDVK